MAGRIVEIKITGDGRNYKAEAIAIERLLCGEIQPVPDDDDVDLIKEDLAELSVKDQQKIYEWLNLVCGCRMPY
jgi:acid stress-induced BolA-like protein IbaG/YrbA